MTDEEQAAADAGFPSFSESPLDTFVKMLEGVQEPQLQDSPTFYVAVNGQGTEAQGGGGGSNGQGATTKKPEKEEDDDEDDMDGLWLVLGIVALVTLVLAIVLIAACLCHQCRAPAKTAAAAAPPPPPQQPRVTHYYMGYRPSYAGELQRQLQPGFDGSPSRQPSQQQDQHWLHPNRQPQHPQEQHWLHPQPQPPAVMLQQVAMTTEGMDFVPAAAVYRSPHSSVAGARTDPALPPAVNVNPPTSPSPVAWQ